MNNGMNTGYLCFQIVAKYLNVKVPKNSAERFRENAETEMELLRLGKQLGMKVKVGSLSVKKMQKTVVPLIAETKENQYIIILTYKNDSWTILDPLKGTPEVISNDDLLQLISGRILAFGKKNSSSYESNHKFGFR